MPSFVRIGRLLMVGCCCVCFDRSTNSGPLVRPQQKSPSMYAAAFIVRTEQQQYHYIDWVSSLTISRQLSKSTFIQMVLADPPTNRDVPSSGGQEQRTNGSSSSSISSSNSMATSSASGKKYTRKRSIPATELRSQYILSERQEAFEKINKGQNASIWSFESLFPAPVVDTESVQTDLQFHQQCANSLDVVSANIKKSSTESPVAAILSLGAAAIKPMMRSTPVAQPKKVSMNATTLKVDPQLTRLVEDRMYGYRRLPSGEYQYETSLLARDSAVQFRNGVRLSNPLPVNADILTYHARKEFQHGRIEEAMELYEIALSRDPADGRAYLGLSKCAERRRDFYLAKKWLAQGISCSVSTDGGSSLPDRGANPFLLMALGSLEEKSGHLARAESLYQAAVASRPSHGASWVALGILRTRKLGLPVSAGRRCFQSAESELQAVGKPVPAHVYTSWGSLEYHKVGDKSKARELFKKAIDVDAHCSAAWLQLGVLEGACQNWEAAETCFETVLRFDQRNTRVLQAYALMETKRPLGDSRKAIGLFERALQTNPRDSGVFQAYALYVAELGDISAARDLFRRGTIVNKRHAAVWQAWGVFESQQGDVETARKIFQQGIWACAQLNGGQSGGYNCDRLWQAWGVLEASLLQFAAARRCYSRSLDANGRNVPAFTAWALMEESLGKTNDARMIFEQALTKFAPGSPDKVALWRSYEVMEQRSGNVEEAQNVYQRSVRDTFTVKDDSEAGSNNAVVTSKSTPTKTFDNAADGERNEKVSPNKKKSEFEVVRWESQGGEVWMNERAIEAKVPNKALKKATTPRRKQQP